jgi:hypothetical protein
VAGVRLRTPARSRFGTVLKVLEDGIVSCFRDGTRAADLSGPGNRRGRAPGVGTDCPGLRLLATCLAVFLDPLAVAEVGDRGAELDQGVARVVDQLEEAVFARLGPGSLGQPDRRGEPGLFSEDAPEPVGANPELPAGHAPPIAGLEQVEYFGFL